MPVQFGWVLSFHVHSTDSRGLHMSKLKGASNEVPPAGNGGQLERRCTGFGWRLSGFGKV